jgi:cytochrome oxidase Cu insertion factor (SCO1/SenC/PrrC family)
MQKIFSFFIAVSLLFTFACNNQANSNAEEAADSTLSNNELGTENMTTNSNSKIEIIYFHTTNRCATCNAVESNAKKLLEENFKAQLDKGEISFASLNIDEDKNKALAEKYLVSFSTLLIINNNEAEPKVTDFTDKAFEYAKNNPEKYIELLKEEINKQITI